MKGSKNPSSLRSFGELGTIKFHSLVSPNAELHINFGSRSCCRVIDLNFSRASLSDDQASPPAVAMTVLSLAGMGLIDSDLVPMLKELMKGARDVEELDLSSNQLSSKGLCRVVEFCQRCPKLRVLKLYRNRIDDRGADELAVLITASRCIHQIHLSHNQLTEEGVALLVTAAHDARSSTDAPFWLRVEHNAVVDPAALLREFLSELSVCERRDEGKCSIQFCCEQRKVHLPFFHVQGTRQGKSAMPPAPPSVGGSENLLDLVVGKWSDHYGSIYTVTMDGVSGTSCSVHTIRPNGTIHNSKGLIRVSGRQLRWSNNYRFMRWAATRWTVSWVHDKGGRGFVWKRIDGVTSASTDFPAPRRTPLRNPKAASRTTDQRDRYQDRERDRTRSHDYGRARDRECAHDGDRYERRHYERDQGRDWDRRVGDRDGAAPRDRQRVARGQDRGRGRSCEPEGNSRRDREEVSRDQHWSEQMPLPGEPGECTDSEDSTRANVRLRR